MRSLCPHRPPCPGCPRFGDSGIPPDALAALNALGAAQGLPPAEVARGAPFGYRRRARLAVRGRAASPKIGIFQEGSHRIADIPRCLVHHPLVNHVTEAVKAAVRRTGVAPYAEAAHRGLLRYVQVVVERASGSAQVVLVANADTPRALDGLAGEVRRRLDGHLHSLWWNGNTARTNTILGPHWHRWVGADAVCERLGGARVFFPPGAFGQANLDLFERLADQARSWVPDGARVLEFHAGCGAIGLGLARRAAWIGFNEAAPAALAGLAAGLAALPPDQAARGELLAGAAAAHVAAVRRADVVLVDPPRRGLDDTLLGALCEHPPALLVAVSCNLAAFLRAARVLLASGRFRLRDLVPWALFPHTAHVEILARFERS